MSDEFDRWLEGELGTRLGHLDGEARTPRYRAAPAHRSRRMSMLSGLSAALSTKAAAAAGVVVAAAATGVGVKAATTGSANPLVWGQQVSHQVQTCKAQRTATDHGIGQCVSKFASTHGQQERNAHAQDGSAHPTPPAHPTAPAHPTPPSGHGKP